MNDIRNFTRERYISIEVTVIIYCFRASIVSLLQRFVCGRHRNDGKYDKMDLDNASKPSESVRQSMNYSSGLSISTLTDPTDPQIHL